MPKTITISGRELYDEATNRFTTIKDTKLVLEHSLISLSKWEAKYKKPFLRNQFTKKGGMETEEEVRYYIECMTILPQNPDPLLYSCLTQENVNEIVEYINDPMTATWFNDNKPKKGGRRSETLTAEVIYWEMIALQIPLDFQKWHLNRLMTLIRVCNEKNEAPNKKMSKADIARRNSALNKARKKPHV